MRWAALGSDWSKLRRWTTVLNVLKHWSFGNPRFGMQHFEANMHDARLEIHVYSRAGHVQTSKVWLEPSSRLASASCDTAFKVWWRTDASSHAQVNTKIQALGWTRNDLYRVSRILIPVFNCHLDRRSWDGNSFAIWVCYIRHLWQVWILLERVRTQRSTIFDRTHMQCAKWFARKRALSNSLLSTHVERETSKERNGFSWTCCVKMRKESSSMLERFTMLANVTVSNTVLPPWGRLMSMHSRTLVSAKG